MIYLPLAIEIVNERTREAEHRALIAAAGRVDFAISPMTPRRPSRARTLAARTVRAISDVTHAFSEAACSAATRIEGAAR